MCVTVERRSVKVSSQILTSSLNLHLKRHNPSEILHTSVIGLPSVCRCVAAALWRLISNSYQPFQSRAEVLQFLVRDITLNFIC